MLANLLRRSSILVAFAQREIRAFSVNQSRSYANACFVMPKTALLILANGAEEIESVVTADVLRRAGVKVTIAGLESGEPVKCSRDVVVVPDESFVKEKDSKFDVVILPGGLGGTKALCGSAFVKDVLKRQEEDGCFIAAICAAPTALAQHGICLGKSLTSYPSVKPQLEDKYKYVDDEKVVQDGILITSRGPGTTMDFALKITEQLVGADKAKEVAKGLLFDY